MSDLPAVPRDDGTICDQIHLRGLVVRGHHGVLAKERRFGQDFVVDVVLHLDTRRAAAADELSETVDYSALATHVAAVVRGPEVSLLETLATRVADAVLTDRKIVAVDVTVHKPHAPVAERFGDVYVVVRRFRGQAAPVRQAREPHGEAGGDT
jgi:dihydroneopterin aldolase